MTFSTKLGPRTSPRCCTGCAPAHKCGCLMFAVDDRAHTSFRSNVLEAPWPDLGRSPHNVVLGLLCPQRGAEANPAEFSMKLRLATLARAPSEAIVEDPMPRMRRQLGQLAPHPLLRARAHPIGRHARLASIHRAKGARVLSECACNPNGRDGRSRAQAKRTGSSMQEPIWLDAEKHCATSSRARPGVLATPSPRGMAPVLLMARCRGTDSSRTDHGCRVEHSRAPSAVRSFEISRNRGCGAILRRARPRCGLQELAPGIFGASA